MRGGSERKRSNRDGSGVAARLGRPRPFHACDNGLDAARILKRLMPTVPLIMYSAFGDTVVEHQARLIGISEVVSKSEHKAVLIQKARGLLYSAAA